MRSREALSQNPLAHPYKEATTLGHSHGVRAPGAKLEPSATAAFKVVNLWRRLPFFWASLDLAAGPSSVETEGSARRT